MNKSINAYQVTTKKDGQSWTACRLTIKADSEAEALQKFKTVAKTGDDYTTTAEPVTVHHINTKLTSDSYPYGRLRCTAFYNVEINKNGCRTIFQTINPKTDRLNAPKKSTYTGVILPIIDNKGHFDSCGHFDFNGAEEINKGLLFMSDFYECFEVEHIKAIALNILAMSKIDAKARVMYSGCNWEDIKPFYENTVKVLTEICNTGANLFINCMLDVKGLDASKNPDYNPFKVSAI